MAVVNFWNMLDLHRYKVVFSCLLLLFASFAVQAQKQKQILVNNLPNYDDRKMHYGFYLGGTATTFRAEHSQTFVDSLNNGGVVSAANPKFSPGFTLGFVISRHLGDFFDLRFVPGVGF